MADQTKKLTGKDGIERTVPSDATVDELNAAIDERQAKQKQTDAKAFTDTLPGGELPNAADYGAQVAFNAVSPIPALGKLTPQITARRVLDLAPTVGMLAGGGVGGEVGAGEAALGRLALRAGGAAIGGATGEMGRGAGLAAVDRDQPPGNPMTRVVNTGGMGLLSELGGQAMEAAAPAVKGTADLAGRLMNKTGLTRIGRGVALATGHPLALAGSYAPQALSALAAQPGVLGQLARIALMHQLQQATTGTPPAGGSQ